MKVDNLGSFEVMTSRDLTPLEHKMMGSTVDTKYVTSPDVPLNVQDGEPIGGVNARRKQERDFIDFTTGLVITDRVIAAIMELGLFDRVRCVFSEPRLVSLYDERSKQFLPVTWVEEEKYREYLETGRRELSELLAPKEGDAEFQL